MTPLPAANTRAVFWRLDDKRYADSWDSGIGARLVGGRWNPAGLAIVYCSLDPATTILESAAHKGFPTLNAVAHVLSRGVLEVDWSSVHLVQPRDVPNRLWLYPCAFSSAQQAFGKALLTVHDFVAIPSAVSRNSWNLLFEANRAKGKYKLLTQEALDLDPRLDPPR